MLAVGNHTVNITVTGATANQTVVANTSGPSTDNVSLDGLAITPLVDGDFWLNVSLSETTPLGAPAATPTGEYPIAYLQVNHSSSDDEISNVTFQLQVSKATLSARGLTPSDVVVYRYHNGTWNPTTMRVVGETTDTYLLEATVPGLSVFAVTADQPATSTATPTPMPTATPTPDRTDATAPSTDSAAETGSPTDGSTVTAKASTTSTDVTTGAGPGFGISQLIVAILGGCGMILLHRRRFH